MKVLVCGGRNFADKDKIAIELARLEPTAICHGGATGADTWAGFVADAWGIPCTVFPADWAKHGRAAGPIRNAQMLKEFRPDVVLAFDGGLGTANMVEQAKRAGVWVVEK